MTNFPLLKLPLVALQETYTHMHPVQLINLSKCSRKMHANVKMLSRFVGRQYYMRVTFSKNSEVVFVPNDETAVGVGIGLEATSETRAEIVGVVEAQNVVHHLWDLFHYPVTRAKMNLNIEASSSDAIFNWIAIHQPKLDIITCYNDGASNDEKYERCLTTFSRNRVHMLAEATDGFRLTRRVKAYFVFLIKPKWLTIDQLHNIECKALMIRFHPTAKEMMNTFLKELQAGMRVIPKIEFLIVDGPCRC